MVKASVGSTEENSSWNERYSSKRRRRKQWSTWSSHKQIVNLIFTKSAQETRRTQLSRLILQKTETPRRRINLKNWLLNGLKPKIPKEGILSLTKVELTIGGWQSVIVFLFTLLFFCLFIILSLVEYKLFLFPCVFDKHREKYAKLDFVKFISLEINYFVGTGCFVFKKYRHTFLSGNKSKLFFSCLSPLFLYISLSLRLAWQLLLDF